MENKNISFNIGKDKFNFRVAALIKHKNKILLEFSWDFWNMPGGRVQMGESTLDALKREMLEEMNLVVEDCELVQVYENFFDWLGDNQHELLFVYKIELDENSELLKKDDFKCSDSDEITFKWHDAKDVKNLKCLPECIYDLAVNDYKTIQHSINVE